MGLVLLFPFHTRENGGSERLCEWATARQVARPDTGGEVATSNPIVPLPQPAASRHHVHLHSLVLSSYRGELPNPDRITHQDE